MKDFFKWFKSSTRVKRWLVLMLIGIVLVCYGIAEILVTKELSFVELVKIILCFTVGFTFAVLSVICIQRRTLELLVQETDTRDLDKKDQVHSLIFNKKVYNQGPNVVVIGGGSGLNTVLRGLKNYTDNITAIVTVSDYGSSENITPLNDIKESLIALSTNEEKMKQLMNAEILISNNQKIKFSDIYFSAMEGTAREFTKSIEDSKNVLNMIGKVLPVTLDTVTICAELEDGTIVESKEKIPQVVNEKVSKINRIYISPTNCRVAPGVLEAIRQADAIVIGPGSLYTNVIPNLLVPGVSREIRESKAFKIYVSNIMTEFGQTDNYSLADHIKAIIEHAGKGIVDYCIYDTGEIIPEYIRKYNKEGCELVEQDINNVKGMGIKLIQRNLSTVEEEAIRHNSDAIATAIIQLICDDLIFNDMQNNPQFLKLDSKVKETKKKLKNDEKMQYTKRSKKKSSKNKTSKFFEKYNDRVESIRESGKSPKHLSSNSAKKEANVKKEEKKHKDIKEDNDLLEIINKMRK